MIATGPNEFALAEEAALDEPAHEVVSITGSRYRHDVEQPDTRDAVRRDHAGTTMVDLLLAGATAVSGPEIEHVAWLAVTLHGYRACLEPLTLPSGRRVASMHAHMAGWRNTGLTGFTDRETALSGLLAPP